MEWGCRQEIVSFKITFRLKPLQGGIPQGTITELVGPSGCGKTQFCLQTCVGMPHDEANNKQLLVPVGYCFDTSLSFAGAH
jgi:archaellum biogenesis ATPase FlaH